jgi:DtxR family transcriptional regulator, Mn-dependent transcriptional regulator
MATWLESLFVFLSGIIIATLLFIPRYGLIPFFKNSWPKNDLTLIEDALKYIQLCDYEGYHATIFSISGALFISCDLTYIILEKMVGMGLIQSNGQIFELTTEGQAYAMRIIRVHRLSEEYLAQKTGYPYEELHHRAHKMEHGLSDTQASDISTQLGNPLFDFHGDPIPSADGNIKKLDEVPLLKIPINQIARISHLEDEPKEVYAQLLAEGLYPGLDVHLKERNKQKIRFTSKEGEHILAPIVAANISVLLLNVDVGIEEKGMILSDLPTGGRTKILELSKRLRKNDRRRLMDLGFIPGTVVEASLRNAHEDLIAFKIRGSLIALRKEQTDQIKIDPSYSMRKISANG